MKKIHWVKFWTRNFGLFRYYVYIESNKLDFYKKNFNAIFHYALTVPDGKLVAYYHDADELKQLTEKIYSVSCKDFKTFEKYSHTIFNYMTDFIDFNEKIDLANVSKYSSKQLLSFFKIWHNKYLHWQIGIYFFFVLEPIVTKNISAMLEDYLKKTNNLDQLASYSGIIMSPEEMNAVALEQKMALQTALAIKKYPKQRTQLIQRYYESFLWLPCYDVHHQAYDLSHFQKQIKNLIKLPNAMLEERLNNLNNEFIKRKSDFNRLVSSITDLRLKELCCIMHWLVYYKDYRDDLRRKAGFSAKPFMTLLGKRVGLNLEEINYLTPPEVIKALQGNTISKQEINNRMPSKYVLLSNTSGIQLFIGDNVPKIIQQELGGNLKAGEEIKGMIASKGKASGRVIIVRHSASLSKVNEGDIMVAVTTHPEYVPAMKKAAGIVTDEGGITSHAAIVSRELHKPCIVGCKTATNMLKNGDFVEVDANKGIVRIIR